MASGIPVNSRVRATISVAHHHHHPALLEFEPSSHISVTSVTHQETWSTYLGFKFTQVVVSELLGQWDSFYLLFIWWELLCTLHVYFCVYFHLTWQWSLDIQIRFDACDILIWVDALNWMVYVADTWFVEMLSSTYMDYQNPGAPPSHFGWWVPAFLGEALLLLSFLSGKTCWFTSKLWMLAVIIRRKSWSEEGE